MVNKSLFAAVAIITGTMMGAGFLGIPYVVSKSGLIPGIILLVCIGLFMMFMKLLLGEVALRTKGTHQLAGYAEKYLGKTGMIIMFLATILGIYSALVAYLIGEGDSLSYFIFGNFGYSFYISLAFWVVLSVLSFIGLRALKSYEKIGFVIAIVFIIAIAIVFGRNITPSNLIHFDLTNLFMPFGVILFSFLAFSAMPEVERVLAGRENLMKKAIIYGSMIPLAVYILFTTVMVGAFDSNIAQIATLSLGRFFSILGIITMFTAFFSALIAMRDMFRFDFKFGRFFGWLLATTVPLVLFLLIHFFQLFSFIQILSFAGVISGGVTGFLILLMNHQAKKHGERKPEYKMPLSWLMIVIFAIILLTAVVLEIIL